MSLKLAVLITGDASQLKSEAADAKAAIAAIGAGASTAGSGLEKLQSSFDGSAAAAGTAKTAIAGVATAAAAAGPGLAKLTATINDNVTAAGKVEAATRSAAAAQLDYRAIIEKTVGIGQSAAAANSNRAAEIADYGRALDDMRARYNPLFAAQRQYLGVLEDIRSAHKLGAIDAAETAAAVQKLDRSYLAQTASLTGTTRGATEAAAGVAAVGTKAALTANQLLNLSRQGNDVVTMWALGADGAQIFASQIGQVFGALQENEKGVKGSLAAIGTGLTSLLTPTTAITAGLLAAGAAAIYFATRGQDKIRPLNEAMEAHRKIIGEIAVSYGAVIRAQETYASGVTRAFTLRQSSNELRLSARSSLLDGLRESGAVTAENRTGEGRGASRATEPYTAFEGPLLKLRQGLRSGTEDAAAFIEEVAKIANADPGNVDLQNKAKKLTALAGPAADAKAQIDALASSIERLRGERLTTAVSNLSGFVPDRTTDRDRINAEADKASGLARSYGELMRIEKLRSDGLAEIDRQETIRRQGYELDLRSINDRTVAEKALTAAERERLALSEPGADRPAIEAKAAAAAAQVRAEAARSADDVLRASQTARDQAGLVGYAGQLAAVNAGYRDQILAASGSAEAVERLQRARKLDLETLEISTRRELFAPQEDELRSLVVEASLIGGTDSARRRALDALKAEQQLVSQGIDLNSELGSTYLANAAKLSEFEDVIRRQVDAWDTVKRSGENTIDSLVDGLASGSADIGKLLSGIAEDWTKTLLELAVANPLKNSLLGTSYGTLGDLMGGKPKAPDLAKPGMQSIAAMTVQATAVYLNGAPIGSGAGGAAGAIDRVLNPANSSGGGTSTGSSGLADSIRQAAATLGIDPKELATVISYETGGTFDPNIMGGAGGRYKGLIQMGPSERAQYGFKNGMSADEQLQGPIVNYFQDRGLKPGMGLLDIYSTVNAGRPGRYNASDAANGGAPGTVRDKVENQMAGHVAKAEALLGKSATDLASGASAFQGSFDKTLNSTLIGGMGQIVDQAVPGFGGIFSTLLESLTQSLGNSGGFGSSWISALTSSITGGATGAAGGADAWAGLRLAKFAGGGIATEPSIFGDGREAEAAVPLPDGRSIPVSLRMAPMISAGGDRAPVITQTFVNAPEIERQTDEPDGRGGRKQEVVFKKAVADATAPGTPAFRKLRRTSNLRQPSVT